MPDEPREPGPTEPAEPPATTTPPEPPPPVAWAPPPPQPTFPTRWGPAAEPPTVPAQPTATPDLPFAAPDQLAAALEPTAPPGTIHEQPAATPVPPPPVAWAAMAPRPKVEVAPGIVFASTPRRLVAYIIDSVVVAIAAYLIAIAILAAFGPADAASTEGGLVVAIVFTALSFVYFVWTWTSGARATPGMRLLKLQVGNAFDGRTLTLDQAARRWIALGEPLSLVGAIPALAGVTTLAGLLLYLVLLLTTIASPTKQGLHDRFARSAVVEPTGLGTTGPVVALVVLVLIFFVVPILIVVALISIGSEMSTLLSTVGSPDP